MTSNAAGGGGPTAATAVALTTTVSTAQLAEEYVRLLDAVGKPNYETIQSLFAGYGCPPASTIPAIQVSFELFEAVQNRFAATKQVLERTKIDLLSRNQQYTVVSQDLQRLQEEHEVLRKRNAEAEERNTDLYQQRAKLEVSVEQLRREVGQGHTALDALRNKLTRREEELQISQSRIAENLVALSQKDAVINTLRRELLKNGSLLYGVGRGAGYHRGAFNGEESEGREGEGDDGGDGDGVSAQNTYTADMLESIAAGVEGRAQEARMKLNVADLESRLSRLQEEKDSVLTQHTQYRQHVQMALQSYEAEAMLREDTMGRHVCLRTPYFEGPQLETYEKVVHLQTGEKLATPTTFSASSTVNRAAAAAESEEAAEGDIADNNAAVDAITAEDTPAPPSFSALTFELKRIVDRFSKVHIDDGSRLHKDLLLCVEAQRHALRASSDLVGFLSCMEVEVLRRRLTLAEVREEWRKACVPELAQAVAVAMRESTFKLGKGLVGLLEQENAFTAEVTAAKLSQRTPSVIASNSADAFAAASASTHSISGSARGKSKKRSQQGLGDAASLLSAVNHVHVGVMARPSGPRHGVAVQVNTSDFGGVTAAAAASPLARADTMMSSSFVQEEASKLTQQQPSSLGGTPPNLSRTSEQCAAAAGFVSISQIPADKQADAGALTSVLDAQSKKYEEGTSNSAGASPFSSTEGMPPSSDAPAAFSSVNTRRVEDADKTAERSHPPSSFSFKEPIVLTGICPNCACVITLSSDPSAAPLVKPPGHDERLALPMDSAPTAAAFSSKISMNRTAVVPQTQVGDTDAEHTLGTPKTPSLRISLDSNRQFSEAVDGATRGAGASHKSTKGAADTASVVEGKPTSIKGATASSHMSMRAQAIENSAEKSGSSGSAVSSTATVVAVAELRQCEARLRMTEQSLADARTENEVLRAQLAAALAAAEESHLAGVEGDRKGAHEGGASKEASSTADLARRHLQNELSGQGETSQHPLTSLHASLTDYLNGVSPMSSKEGVEALSLSKQSSTSAQDQEGQAADTSILSMSPAADHGAAPLRLGEGGSANKTDGVNGSEDDAAAGNLTSATKSVPGAATSMMAGQTHTLTDAATDGVLCENEDGVNGIVISQWANHSTTEDDGAVPPKSGETSRTGSHMGRYTPSPRPGSTSAASASSVHASPPPAGAATAEPNTPERGTQPTRSGSTPDLPKGRPNGPFINAAQNAQRPTSLPHAIPVSQILSSSRPSQRSVEDNGEERADGVTPPLGHSSRAPRQTGAAAAVATAGHGFKTTSTSRHVMKLPIIGYPGSATQCSGPAPSYNMDLVIMGVRTRPTSSTTTSSQLFRRSLASIENIGNNNSNSTVNMTSTKRTTSFKLAKGTGGSPPPLPFVRTSPLKDASSSSTPKTDVAALDSLGSSSATVASPSAFTATQPPPPPLPAIQTIDGRNIKLDSAAVPPPTQSDSATKQAVLRALLSPPSALPPRLPITAVEPVKLTSRQELQLFYQVLRLRPAVWIRRGGGGGAARLWQRPQRGGMRRSFFPGSTILKMMSQQAKTPGSVVAPFIDSTVPAVMTIPRGCVQRPFIIRRVLAQRHIGPQRLTLSRKHEGSLSFSADIGGVGGNVNGLAASHVDDTYRTNSGSTVSYPASMPPPSPPPELPFLVYRYYLSTPAEVPRLWFSERRYSCTIMDGNAGEKRGGNRPYVRRTWQQQRRYERALWLRQTARDTFSVRGLSMPSRPISLSSRLVPPTGRASPSTAAHLKREAPQLEKQHCPLFPQPPVSVPAEDSNINTKDSGATTTAPSLKPTALPLSVYKRAPRPHTRAAMLRAKRDPTRRAVKRNVYTITAPPPLSPFNSE